MTPKRQIGLAVGGSVIGHLLLAGGATAILAFKRAAPPENDDFADGSLLRGGLIASAHGDNFYATRQFAEPAHVGTVAGGSVWWRWHSPERCAVEVGVEADGFEEVTAIYRGAVLGTLVEVTAREPGDTRPLRFIAEAETTYHIAVAGAGASELGEFSLSLLADPDAEDTDDLDEELVLLLPEMFVVEEEAEPEPPDELQFVRTAGNERERDAPDRPRFESDRNTHAASVLDGRPDGEEDMPTVDGQDLPFGDLAEREYIDGEFDEESALPITAEWAPERPAVPERLPEATVLDVPELQLATTEPRPAITETLATDLPTPTPVETMAPMLMASPDTVEARPIEASAVESSLEEIASVDESAFVASEPALESIEGPLEEVLPEPLAAAESVPDALPPAELATAVPRLEPTPPLPEETPAEKAVDKPDEPTFQAHTLEKSSVGRLSNKGERVALDAAETPLGRYRSKVDKAVHRSWQRARTMHADLASYGILKVRFWIDATGKVVELRVLENNANAATASFSIAGIKAAAIPAIPDDLVEQTQDGRMEFEYYIILH